MNTAAGWITALVLASRGSIPVWVSRVPIQSVHILVHSLIYTNPMEIQHHNSGSKIETTRKVLRFPPYIGDLDTL